MADMYVYDSASSTAAPYDTWDKAAVTLDIALAAQAVGGIVWVASDHAEEEGANYTLAATNGTSASPIRVISADRTSGEPPATYQTMVAGSGLIYAGATYDLVFTGAAIFIGMNFKNGDDITMTDEDKDLYFIDCKIQIFDLIQIGSKGDTALIWRDVDLVCLDSVYIALNASFQWEGGTLTFDGGSIDTGLFRAAGRGGYVKVSDVDMSALANNDYLIHTPADLTYEYTFKRCKLGSYSGLTSAAITGSGVIVKVHHSANANEIYQLEEEYFEGSIYSDTGVYLDATYDGTNGYSAKMVSSANVIEWVKPLKFKLAEIYIDATGKTLTVETLTDNVTLQNDEFWLEVEYPDSTTKALGNILKTKSETILTAPANLTASGVTWTESTIGTPVEQKVVADFSSESVTDEAAGVYTVWACLAKEATVYVDPKITVA